ncbi:MAG: HEAT repeat domain-containing protein [Myxococcales bacterium]|nr:HEAT repeat domain-containing protein [Myxococcales bacterium]
MLLLAACDQSGGDGAEAAPSGSAAADGPVGAAKVKIDEVKGMVKEGVPISAEQYEKLILAHANCEVTDNGIDGKCEAVKILSEAMNRSQLAKGALGGNAGLGQKLIDHPAPAVRIKAAQIMSSFLGTGKKSQDVILAAAKKEQHPAVLTAMIRTIRNDGKKNPEIGKFLLEIADHENPKIRKEAIYALSSSWNEDLGVDKLITMMKSDKDMKVRQTACEYAGKVGDPKLFPVYDELLKQREPGDLWGDCLEGLISMWGDYPLYGTANQQAYDLTLKLLESTPRTEQIPPWTIMTNLGYLGAKNNKKLDEWKTKATWYKPEALRKALMSIVADSNAKWMARTGATKALVELGASKADFQKLRTPLGDAPKGTDTHVAKELDKAIAAAP